MMNTFRYTTGNGFNAMINLDYVVEVEHKPNQHIILHFVNGTRTKFRANEIDARLPLSKYYFELRDHFGFEDLRPVRKIDKLLA